MQRTRLSTLFDTAGNRLTQLTDNPWRRILLGIMMLLLGFFVGASISTIAGQRGALDVVGSALLVLFIEVVSRLFYSRSLLLRVNQRPLWLAQLNIFKIGLMYSLFLEAFKLGS